MRRQQRGQPRGVAAGHAAYGGDAVDLCVAARGREAGGGARRVVVVDEAEIKLGLGLELPSGSKRPARAHM
jgi:hypothetical protein